MRIYFEEHQYQATDEVLKDLRNICALQDVDKKISVSYVGYYYNREVKDCIFILPKVLLEDKQVDEKATLKDTIAGMEYRDDEGHMHPVMPEDIISRQGQEKYLNDGYRRFIYGFAVWIYRALCVYRKLNDKSNVIYYCKVPQEGHGRRRETETFLDVVLSLIRFNEENQNFFTFTIKNLHSGLNKVNWNRTINRTTALVQDDAAIYLNPINKTKRVNFEEELFVIFFSILHYIEEQYGFRTPINCGYELMKGAQFKAFSKRATVRLKQIKYKYFSDKMLRMWDLCFAFFEDKHKLSINTYQQEYLLAKNFNIVFESMIDELIGEKKIPRGLKEQYDGKQVDHMFTYHGPTFSDEQRDDKIYYIGDSKYYKVGHPLGRESIYKQYTYARNVIQWNIDLFMEGQRKGWTKEETEEYRKDLKDFGDIRLRNDEQDPLTEGYNVIPNFFLSAFVYPDHQYVTGNDIKGHPSNIKEPERDDEGKIIPQTHISFQFADRLFDRDTLILSHYDVNFLYVIYLYARNKSGEKKAWRDSVREIFRDEIRKVLQRNFDFFALKSNGNPIEGEEFIREHFKELQGKLYRPYGDSTLYALALEKDVKDEDGNIVAPKDRELFRMLQEHFSITEVKLGVNPKQELENQVAAYQSQHPYRPTPKEWLPEYHIERYADNYFVVGLYHDQAHWEWITGKNDKGSLIYNVRLDPNRKGSMPRGRIRAMKPRFAILYEEGHETDNKYHVFRIHDFAVMSKERMKKALYPRPKGNYFIFRFDEEVSIGQLDINRYISMKRLEPDFEEGMPLYPKGEELMKYKR